MLENDPVFDCLVLAFGRAAIDKMIAQGDAVFGIVGEEEFLALFG